MRHTISILSALTLAVAVSGARAQAQDPVVHLTLKDHRFSPAAVEAPAGRRVTIELTNLDPATEEFDSEDLHVEKDVTPNGKVRFVIGPLNPGRYSFIGELHAGTASGTITAVTTP